MCSVRFALGGQGIQAVVKAEPGTNSLMVTDGGMEAKRRVGCSYNDNGARYKYAQ